MTEKKICANCRFYYTPKCSHAEDFKKRVDGTPLMTETDSCPDFYPKEKKKDLKEKEVNLYSCGFYDVKNKFVFEQLADHKFATNLSDDLKDNITIGGDDYFPEETLPWEERLIEEPLEYGTEAELQKEVGQYIYDHCYLTDQRLYDALTAWIFHTWVPEVFDVVPYLFIHGPKNTGKTRLSDVACELSFRGLSTPDTSEAALFRCMELLKPTLFIDENSSLNQDVKAALVDVLDSGYKRGSFVMRCDDQGNLKFFRVFGPKCINGTKPISETLESRSIPVRSIKNARRVRNSIDRKKAAELRAKLLTWRFNYLSTWNGERCEACEACEGFLGAFDGRIQELFTPLLTVTNGGERDNILSFIKSMANERIEEDKASVDAEFVDALAKIDLDTDQVETELKEKVVLIKTVGEKINADRSETDKYKPQTIGNILKRLGFSRRHTRKGNGVLYDESRVNDLKNNYYPTVKDLESEGGSKKPSPPSPPSYSSQEIASAEADPLLKVCKFCGKPITGNIHDWVGPDLSDPAHLECARQWRELQETGKEKEDSL